MFEMFLERIRKDDDIINKRSTEVSKWFERLIHKSLRVCWGISIPHRRDSGHFETSVADYRTSTPSKIPMLSTLLSKSRRRRISIDYSPSGAQSGSRNSPGEAAT